MLQQSTWLFIPTPDRSREEAPPQLVLAGSKGNGVPGVTEFCSSRSSSKKLHVCLQLIPWLLLNRVGILSFGLVNQWNSVYTSISFLFENLVPQVCMYVDISWTNGTLSKFSLNFWSILNPDRIDSDGVIKVADFALAEDIYSSGYFRQDKSEGSVKLPFKWMALGDWL